MAITRACDYCEKQESDAGFIEHYEVQPTRMAGKPTLVMDLCGECSALLTRPAVREFKAKAIEPPAPIVTVDGSGKQHVRRTRLRENRCPAMLRQVRCIWDKGHAVEHQAANGQHWGKAS